MMPELLLMLLKLSLILHNIFVVIICITTSYLDMYFLYKQSTS